MNYAIQPFPPLPIETVIAIVEAAAASSRSTALTLALVSKRVYSWTKPVLYHTVDLSWRNLIRFINGFFTHNFSYADDQLHAPRSLIRNLFITDCSGPGLLHVVDRCEHLDRLLCDTDIIECTTTTSRPREIIIHSASRSPTIYGDNNVVPPVLQSVTHLFVEHGILNDKFTGAVASLQHLTHLGLSVDQGSMKDVIIGIKQLLAITSLQSFVILSGSALKGPLWIELAELSDERLIVGVLGVTMDSPLKVARAGGSMWASKNRLKDWKKHVC